MNIKEYIASGILELYIAGVLPEQEMQEVYRYALEHQEIYDEIIKIEDAIVKLTKTAAPKRATVLFDDIKKKLSTDNNKIEVIPITKSKNNWFAYSGWAASLLLLVGLAYFLNKNNNLEQQLDTITNTTKDLKKQIELANEDLANTTKLNTILRANDIIKIPLTGQTVSPNSYANVYWDKKTNQIYLDAQGLPEPPKGKVYQVWSLKLNPLTPTDLGIVANFSENKSKVFEIKNTNESQAFGITLEPEGGSKSPTLEQLYTLGVVNSTP